jgi:alpha-D-ribose 1-methylphosphonate 5-triphosphate diphosphatase
LTETVFANARLILADRILEGSMVSSGWRISQINAETSDARGAIDLEGDLLIPGIIDLHTDNLERQVQPRMNARWPSRSAMIAHDAQCAGAGVTTVFDSFCVGDLGFEEDRRRTFVEGVADLDALTDAALLKSDHLIHLRCELPAPDMEALFDPYAGHPRLALVSLMDHSPGVGQWGDVSQFRAILRRDGLTEPEIDARLEHHREGRQRHREP